MNELDVNKHMGFTLESPEDVRGIVQRFVDLFENRKFNKINEAQASLERRIKEAKASELFDSKINARSEKLVGRDSSIPRVQMIIQKGHEYEQRKFERFEEKLAKERSDCTFKPQILDTKTSDPELSAQLNQRKGIHDHLYKTGLEKWSSREGSRTAEDIEF